MSTENIIEVPEIGPTSQLMDEIRKLVRDPKYDRMATSELIGILAMLQFEYMTKWMEH